MNRPGPGSSALLTDLYQLTMLQAYRDHGMEATAVFELFVRRLPPTRGFLVAAGLEAVVEFLEALRFEAAELDWLRAEGTLRPDFVESLASLRFTGDLDALPEGTIFFSREPILRIVAPLPEAQLVEPRIINLVQHPVLVASKAARLTLAARGRPVIDFGLRRTHGAEAGLQAARAAWLGGLTGTATVLAARRFGIPIYGTMAHSFIEACPGEREAFERFARSHPDHPVLLVDTYDTLEGTRRAIEVAGLLERDGIHVGGLRLDSGNLLELSRGVRRLLDEAGLARLRIVASGGLDEHEIEKLLAADAPIDGFGVGTSLAVSVDAPALDIVYKLQEYDGTPRRKRSEGKATWPGRKQAFRRTGADGVFHEDVLGLEGEAIDGEPLLEPVLRGGRRVAPLPELARSRELLARSLEKLPAAQRALRRSRGYPVRLSPALRRLARSLDRPPSR